MLRVLGKDGVYGCIKGLLYVSVVQAVLLYGSEKWVMYPHIGRTLSGVQHMVVHRLVRQ